MKNKRSPKLEFVSSPIRPLSSPVKTENQRVLLVEVLKVIAATLPLIYNTGSVPFCTSAICIHVLSAKTALSVSASHCKVPASAQSKRNVPSAFIRTIKYSPTSVSPNCINVCAAAGVPSTGFNHALQVPTVVAAKAVLTASIFTYSFAVPLLSLNLTLDGTGGQSMSKRPKTLPEVWVITPEYLTPVVKKTEPVEAIVILLDQRPEVIAEVIV